MIQFYYLSVKHLTLQDSGRTGLLAEITTRKTHLKPTILTWEIAQVEVTILLGIILAVVIQRTMETTRQLTTLAETALKAAPTTQGGQRRR